MRIIATWVTAAVYVATPAISATLTVTQPTGATIVAAGDDYATQVLGNPWDMKDASDIDIQESSAVANQSLGSGTFSGDTTANGAWIFPLFMGYVNSINLNLNRGANYPVDTSHYRYVTFKSQASQPASTTQFTRVVFYPNQDSSIYGETYYATLPASQWRIFTFDMVTNNDGLHHNWLDFTQAAGLRIEPSTTNASGPYASVHFSINWIRLTASATNAQKTSVVWTDTGIGGSYDISVSDSGGTTFALGANVRGTSYAVDLTFLPPGTYTITVARSDSTATANSATFHINSPPQIAITAPNVRGDQSRDFATTVVGNAWGPITSTDFVPAIGVRNFTNVSYSNPVNSFYGRPTSKDPGWFFNLGGQTIDTSVYRSLCYAMEVFGPRNIGTGSIARVFWGNGTSGTQLTTSADIPLDDNAGDTLVSEYCIPDLAAALLEAGTNGGDWSGTKSVFRIDPDEFTPPNGCSTLDVCHDVRLDSVTLSPFALANPGYTFKWTLTDPDNASDTVDVYLDPDSTPLNGDEIHLGSATMPSGSGQFAWSGSCANVLTYGPWHVLMVASDGINPVSQYAGGPLLIGRYDGIFRNGFETVPAVCP